MASDVEKPASHSGETVSTDAQNSSGRHWPLTRRRFLIDSALASSGAGSLIPVYANAGIEAAHSTGDAAALQTLIQGRVISPLSNDYDSLHRLAAFNTRTGLRPALIARCETEEDVRRAVMFAQQRGLEVAVRSGGHDVMGASTVAGGLVIDLRAMNAIVPDITNGTVRVGGGTRSGNLNEALQLLGRAVSLGGSSDVGVSGLALNGGLGWLLGTDGAACDNLVSATIMTADGQRFVTDANQEPELFWAIRGGGGNFGIATSLTFRTRPLGQIIGGHIVFSGTELERFLRFYRDFMAVAPDELSVQMFAKLGPQPILLVSVCFTGNKKNAGRVLSPLRNFGSILADDINSRPFAAVSQLGPQTASHLQQSALPRATAKEMESYWKGGSLDALSDSAIDAILGTMAQAKEGYSFGIEHYMHGAICRVGDSDTPFVRRPRSMIYYADAAWQYAANAPDCLDWVDATLAALAPYSRHGTAMTLLSSDDEADIERAYDVNYPRLTLAKRKYDPGNVFHRNRNILPAPEQAPPASQK